MTQPDERSQLLAVLRGLMLAENLGDVHDQINRLHDVLSIPRPEGSFLEGEEWTDQDRRNVGLEPEHDD